MLTNMDGRATRRFLLDDHVALLRLFDDVLALLNENQRDETRAAWTMFESALSAHFEAEEELLLPAFRLANPVEAKAITDDHVRFRAKLDELGIAVDLHTIRADAASEMIEALKAHAQREDASMYPWVESHLDEAGDRGLRERLRAAVATRSV